MAEEAADFLKESPLPSAVTSTFAGKDFGDHDEMEKKGDEMSKSKHIFGALVVSFSLIEQMILLMPLQQCWQCLWQLDSLHSTHDQSPLIRISHKNEVD